MSTQHEQIAVFFGGRSVEHEISVISGLQLILALDQQRYDVIPVYIATDGRWFTGADLLERDFYRTLPKGFDKLEEIVLLPQPNIGGFFKVRQNPLTSEKSVNITKRSAGSFIAVDVCLLAFHGQYGEDGCLQGLLELADLPYTGCNVLSTALAMNKSLCKTVLSKYGIPVLPWAMAHKRDTFEDIAEERKRIFSEPGLSNYPLFVKPNHLGSSVGIGKAHDDATLNAALLNVFRYDLEAIIEPSVENLLEINISILDGEELIASVTETPVSDSGVLSYEEKYLRGGGKKSASSDGMASLTRVIDPPDLDPALKETVTEYAKKSFRVLGCSGLVRFDFMLDVDSGELYFNELNPIPGSFAFYLWEKSHPVRLYTENINQIIASAKFNYDEQAALKRDIGLKALKG